MTISKKLVASGDQFELIKLCYALNQDKFKSEFGKVQIKIDSEDDLQNLANLAKSKLDVSGKLKDESGNPIVFDTMRIVNGMSGYTEQEKQLINLVD